MSVSILINSHNRPKGLRRALQSLESQTYKDFEVVICDDSIDQDAISFVINDFIHLNMKYYHIDSCGAAEALHEALKLSDSNSKYIKVLHDDDYLDIQSLELTVEALDNNPDCNVVFNRALIRYEKEDKECYNYGNDLFKLPSDQYEKGLLESEPFQSPVCALFRRHPNFSFFWEYDNTDLREFARKTGAGTDIQISIESALSNKNVIFLPRLLSFLCTDMDSCTQTITDIAEYYKLWIDEYKSNPNWKHTNNEINKQEQPLMRVMIGTPSYDGKLIAQYVDALLRTKDLCAKHNIEVLPLFLCFDALVQRARNDIFQMAYENDIDQLFFIDADIIWNPEDFLKMVKHEVDFVLAAYPKKSDNESYVIDAREIPDLTKELNEVNGGGCGFMRISKNAIKQIYENAKSYSETHKNNKMVFDIGIENGNFIGEDILFCRKAKELGIKIYLDHAINLGHFGNKEYRGDFESYLKNFKEFLEKEKNK